MAHEITNEDGLVLHRKAAWHGLGTIVENAPTTYEAMLLANLEWRVGIRKLFLGTEWDARQVDNHFAVVREDTNRVFGVQSGGYTPMQNSELADLVEGLAVSGAIPRAESAGSMRHGRNVFFLIKQGSFDAAAGDEVGRYVLFANSHDGSAALRVLATTVRVVCANTLNAALSEAKHTIHIRHTRGLPSQVASAKQALQALALNTKEFETQVKQLANRTMTREELRSFFVEAYTIKLGRPIPINPTDEAEEKTRQKALETVAGWLSTMEREQQKLPSIRGSAWVALNAVTNWADHGRTVRVAKKAESAEDARNYSNLFGTSAAFKGQVLQKALTLVG
jgi:phage/plasmid-like protein (TIGR03299 family)